VFGTHDLWLFVLSALLLNITPGTGHSIYALSHAETLVTVGIESPEWML